MCIRDRIWSSPLPSQESFTGKWWQVFSDTLFNKAFEEFTGSNPDLLSISHQIESSNLLAKINGATRTPNVSLSSAGSSRQQNLSAFGFSLGSLGLGGEGSDSSANNQVVSFTSDNYSANVAMQWEIDIWGKLRNQRKAAFKNFEAAIKYQRKDGSMPIETRRGGRAMFYQGRAMNALTVIAIIAENQGYNIWDYEYKGKNFHNIVKFFIDFTENNEIVFKYAKEMKAPGPAKDYKRQDLDGSSSSNWGWLYAYASRFPNHENIQRLKQWSSNNKDLNNYQRKIISNFDNVFKRNAGTSSWTVVEPRCHFTK